MKSGMDSTRMLNRMIKVITIKTLARIKSSATTYMLAIKALEPLPWALIWAVCVNSKSPVLIITQSKTCSITRLIKCPGLLIKSDCLKSLLSQLNSCWNILWLCCQPSSGHQNTRPMYSRIREKNNEMASRPMILKKRARVLPNNVLGFCSTWGCIWLFVLILEIVVIV